MLRYAQFFTEAVDQKTAFARIDQIAKLPHDPFFRGGTLNNEYIFAHEPDNPPMSRWNDVVSHRERVGGLKLQHVPVNKLIPTQDGVTITLLKRLIKANPARWNENKEEVVSVVKQGERYYVMDGTHRCAAAILMGYPTIEAEVREA
jgi:hypothetical protein